MDEEEQIRLRREIEIPLAVEEEQQELYLAIIEGTVEYLPKFDV